MTAFAPLVLAACSAQSPGFVVDKSQKNLDGIDVAQAMAASDEQSSLPPSVEALAIAESIKARGVREGAGGRATSLYTIAARLLERVWRVDARDRDANEAIDIYRAASRQVSTAGACEAGLAGARLMGDLAHDPATTYAELYRIQRRFALAFVAAGGALQSCQRAVESGLALLIAFRPASDVLGSIDDALAGEGTVAPTLDVRLPGRPQIAQVESWVGRDAARVVIVLDRPGTYRIEDEAAADGGDPSTFLDFDGVELGAIPDDVPGQGIVTRIRTEATTTGSRVRLHVDGHVWRHVFELREPYRVVVDVARRPPGADGTAARTVSRVVLDPGHGGSDNGARGPTGLEEKGVVLDIARRVAPVLAAQGIQVVLTRDDDRYVSLEERTARANAFGADLFVSIHCNASEGRARRGIESYVLDTNRDEIAGRIAARENSTTQSSSTDLGSILLGMRMADGARRSTRLAQLLLRASTTAVQAAYGDSVDGGVHAAGFYVLVGARMPAVLFETSYISSAKDEQRLGTAEYRQLLGDAIANALRAYREGR